MSISKPQVLEALRRIKGPDLESNIVDLGLVSEIMIKDARVYFSVTVPAERASELEPLREAAQKIVSDIKGVAGVTAVLTAESDPASTKSPPMNGSSNVHEHPRVKEAREHARSTSPGNGGMPTGQQTARPAPASVPGVKHLIAIASGKGGVGKSTTAVNLALGLKAIGLNVGILDADIYGPSQPRLLGLSGEPQVDGKTIMPMVGYGIKTMSMGFMVDEATPVIWRGPMVVQALNQMLRDVAWGELDVLVIDMPPGTGDVQLTMAQQVPLSGAVIVSTPQDLALIDARKGLNMFRRVDVPVLGIIENMSYFECPKCGERSNIFGHGGAKDEADKLDIPYLGGVPLDMEIRARSDSGKPVTATLPESTHADVFRALAAATWSELEAAEGKSAPAPKLMVSPDSATLHVEFDNGESHDLTAEMLRVLSPSAEVQGHSPEQRVVVGGKKNVKINELAPIGNYAVKIVFDDGHSTGLYTWSYLQELGREKEQRWTEYLTELESNRLSRS